MDYPDNTASTPIERHGNVWLKRDDLYARGGIRGGKVRSCWHLTKGATGLTTASVRISPQQQIVSRIARVRGIPCRIHTAIGAMTPEMADAEKQGAELVRHKPGYTSVLTHRAIKDAADRGWLYVPFGMEFERAVECTRKQVIPKQIPPKAKRLLIAVGSGMSAAGVLWGLDDHKIDLSVVGVRVGSNPIPRLDKYAPPNWRDRMTLIETEANSYDKHVDMEIDGVRLDPHYEGKAGKYLQPGDLFWLIGIRHEEH